MCGRGEQQCPLAAPRVSSRGSTAHRLEMRPLAATVVLSTPAPALHFWLILPASVTPLGWLWFGAWSPDGPHPGSVGPVSAPRPSLPSEDAPCPRLETDWSQILMLPENTVSGALSSGASILGSVQGDGPEPGRDLRHSALQTVAGMNIALRNSGRLFPHGVQKTQRPGMRPSGQPHRSLAGLSHQARDMKRLPAAGRGVQFGDYHPM